MLFLLHFLGKMRFEQTSKCFIEANFYFFVKIKISQILEIFLYTKKIFNIVARTARAVTLILEENFSLKIAVSLPDVCI